MDAACPAGGACIEVEDALAFVDGNATGERRDEIERKIDACARCRGVIAEAARDGVRTVRDSGNARRRPVSVDQLAPGTAVGRYVVERAIGAGGMGVVSLARDPELRRAVVIKLVRPDFGEGRDDLEDRLRREAQAMAQLSHPNVVQIFDLGRHGDRVFLAMEFVPGQTLDAWLIERPRSIAEVLAMFCQAGAGLDAAHRSGLVHRDFKPANVLVTRDGVPKVTDFGLARSLAVPTTSLAIRSATGVHAVLTQVDSVLGTPAYMAPEQAAGRAVDERTDQYAFALALLDALLAQLPTARRVKPAGPVAEALAEAGVEPRVRVAIARALSEDPAARFESLGALLRELAPPRPDRRGWPIAVAIAVAASAIAVTAWIATRPDGASCVATAPDRWTAARATTLARLASEPHAFAAWRASRIASTVDAAIARLGTDEVAHCQGVATVDPGCLQRRRAALDRLIGGEDPRALVPELERCAAPEPAVARETAALERELGGAITATRARAIAARGRELGDELTVVLALDRAAQLALAAGQLPEAERDFGELATTGNRAGNDVARGLAHLGLLELADRHASLAAATTHADALRALLAQYGASPRDEVTIALVEGRVFDALGDAVRARTVWDAATRAAARLGPDDRLLVQLGRARSLHARLDLDGARRAAGAAVAIANTSPALRARGHATVAELALAAGDGKAAAAADAEARRLDPRGVTLADQLREARTRAVSGEPDAALAALAALQVPDPIDTIRIAVARGQILHAAGRAAEALEVLVPATKPIALAVDDRGSALAMPVEERVAALLLRCEVEVEVAELSMGCFEAKLALDKLHPKAPARTRHIRARVRDRREQPNAYVEHDLGELIEILLAIGAPPVQVADVRWELARDPTAIPRDARANAIAARTLYATAGRLDEVAAIDRWLAGPVVDAGAADIPAEPDGDPWTTTP